MRKKIDITILPKEAFWDLDINSLSIIDDMELIIPRVLMATNKDNFSESIKLLERFYTRNEIYMVSRNTKERISNEVCKMISKRYGKKLFSRYKI